MKNLKKNRPQNQEHNNNPLSVWRGGSHIRTICFLVFGLLLLALAGCAYKPYWPQASSDYSVENRYAIVQNDSLDIVLRPQTYSGEAQSVGSEFFNLFVRVKNTTSQPITLEKSQLGILADEVQYDHIPLQVVLGTIQTLYLISSYEDPFQALPGDPFEEAAENSRTQYLELVNNYFSFGKLLPGGTKEGYLFYDPKLERLESFQIDVWDTKVTFSK